EYDIPANQKRDALEKKIISAMAAADTNSPLEVEVCSPVQDYAAEEVSIADPGDATLDTATDSPGNVDCDVDEVTEVDSMEKSLDLAAVQDEEEEEYSEQDAEQEDAGPSPEERIGSKLLGLATPVGKKQVFESPAVSKSGSKPYEKYNVHWRYEDYENTPGNATSIVNEEQVGDVSPVKWVDSESWSAEESPAREGQKLRGTATPAGKSIHFVSPNKTVEKEYLQYNVHWT
ncbi:unnamed protein product, partial [Symbiodinium microadriaticum]